MLTTNSSDNFIFTETANRLLERLALLKIQPKNILLQDNSKALSIQQLNTLYPTAVITDNHSADEKYDLIIDNCSLLHTSDFKIALFITKKMLNNDGLVIFCTLGRETFPQYHQQLTKTLKLIDMHNLGDLLLNLHFTDPVMEMEIVRLSYKKLTTLQQDLQDARLLGDDSLSETSSSIETTLEIIYGHAAHKPGVQHQYTDADNNTFISIDSIEYMD